MATITDIAKRAGVSVATVSRTMRNPDAVRPVRRERVLRAIEEMNYTPNAIARQLRRRRNEAIIVIVPEIANPFFSNIVQSIENVAHDLGYRVLIGETQGKQERLDYYADMVLTRAADGLILLGSILPTVVAANLGPDTMPSIPLVLACERFDGLNCPNVSIDNVAAARLAVQHLVDRGCRRIATIAGPAGNTLSQDRLQGYRETLQEAGLPAQDSQIAEGDFSIDSGYVAMQRLLDLDPLPDGVFCANDEMAIGAQQAIRERGMVMPGDVAIVGFDDLRFGNFTVPPLTTIRQPTAALGETAMHMMDAVLKKKPIKQPCVVLPHALVQRASTGPS
ncbi:LacI family DNA-binding transcriptional regulator [Sphingobium sp. H39-3-25]|uniref:LacI family DNA-binding transcriptional regulator n=1 Tax=Sphingobium arseniciresistens TaxID=3030834 RepID=UPI0023B90CD4|nr:LacI family DNA-binding transcriptional regulator [Sphingobium arseniciresistens]